MKISTRRFFRRSLVVTSVWIEHRQQTAKAANVDPGKSVLRFGEKPR